MNRISGFTLIEIMLAVLIMAFAIIPISDHLGKSSVGTRAQHSENEAMQYACDKMDFFLNELDFDDLITIGETPVDYGKTQIKWDVLVAPIPLTTMTKFKIPKIPYHAPCNFTNVSKGKEEYTPSVMTATTSVIQDLTFDQLDKERLDGRKSGADRVELKDFKLTVKWKFKGAPDTEFDRHPIVLISRKARL